MYGATSSSNTYYISMLGYYTWDYGDYEIEIKCVPLIRECMFL